MNSGFIRLPPANTVFPAARADFNLKHGRPRNYLHYRATRAYRWVVYVLPVFE
jgi:hypothetical protein